MKDPKKILKYFIIFQIIATGYILLTSKIISYKAEKQVINIIYDSVAKWDNQGQALINKVNQRETELSSTVDEKLVDRLSGKILFQAESNGEIWYLHPLDKKRYYLGRPQDAWRLFRYFGLELESNELLDYLYFAKALPENLKGRFVWAKDTVKEIYYFPPDKKEPALLRSSDDNLKILQALSTGITNVNIRKITVGVVTEAKK